MGANVSGRRVDFGRVSGRSSVTSSSFAVKNQSHYFREPTQSQNHEEQQSEFQTYGDKTYTKETDIKEIPSKSSMRDPTSSRSRSRITHGALFSDRNSFDIIDDLDTSSSITIGNGTAAAILKKLRNSCIQEQKTKSEKTLLDSKITLTNESNRGTRNTDIRPMVTSNSPKYDSNENILSDDSDSYSLDVTQRSTFNSNLYNEQSRLTRSRSKLGFTELKSGDIKFTAYIGIRGFRLDEYEKIKKLSQHRIRGLEKQQNCAIRLYDEPLEMKAQPVFKLQITGPGYREVITCKNSLPKYITERMITADSSVDELFSKYRRRK